MNDEKFNRLIEIFDELKSTSRFDLSVQHLRDERETLLKELDLEIDYPLFGKGILEIKKVIYRKDYRAKEVE